MMSYRSFHKSPMGALQLFTLFTLILSYFSLVVAVPVDSPPVKALSEVIEARDLSERETLPTPLGDDDDLARRSLSDVNLETRSAGLRWGPIYIGNLKLYLTNPHTGPAGPKFPSPSTPHVNFRVDKKASNNNYVAVVNLHIVKYSSRGKVCVYAWDSVTKKTVFDNCFDNWPKAIEQLAIAAKNFVEQLLKNANFFAALAILAGLVIVIEIAVTSLAVVAVV